MSRAAETLAVRPARDGDRAAVLQIYNHYVATTAVTFDTRTFTRAERAGWFGQFAPEGPHRLLVAERAGAVAGWAASMRLRPKPAYDRSVETTVYVAPDALGQGVGRRLCDRLLAELAVAGLHRAYAVIALPNPASVALHRRLGYRHVGTLSEAGHKFGRYWDVAWYERPL